MEELGLLVQSLGCTAKGRKLLPLPLHHMAMGRIILPMRLELGF
jgi:hypothetical protein